MRKHQERENPFSFAGVYSGSETAKMHFPISELKLPEFNSGWWFLLWHFLLYNTAFGMTTLYIYSPSS